MIVHGSLCTVLVVLVRGFDATPRESATPIAKLRRDWFERQNLCGVCGSRLVLH